MSSNSSCVRIVVTPFLSRFIWVRITQHPQYKSFLFQRELSWTSCNHCCRKGIIWYNSWYTSLPLYKYLHCQGTLVCGAIQSNRQGFPEQVNNAKLITDEQKASHSDELLAIKFKDKIDVYMLSTIHDDSIFTIFNRYIILAQNIQKLLKLLQITCKVFFKLNTV